MLERRLLPPTRQARLLLFSVLSRASRRFLPPCAVSEARRVLILSHWPSYYKVNRGGVALPSKSSYRPSAKVGTRYDIYREILRAIT